MMHELSTLPRLSLVACGIITALTCSAHVYAEGELQFDNSFLRVAHPEKIDLKVYGNNAVPAGKYKADIYLNNRLVLTEDVQLGQTEAGRQKIYLSRASLESLQLRDSKVCAWDKEQWCDFQAAVPESRISFDSSKQRIDISVPQAMLQHIARDEIKPESWDAGIPALMMGYNVNGYQSENDGGSYNSLYSALNAGLNIGSWYFRHNGSFSWQQQDNSQQKKYTVQNSYVQHAIPAISGNMLIGQSNTTGRLFDSVAFIGTSVSNDDRMLPASRRGYAPEIRGTARTNAKVMVRQNGQLIYEVPVSPGEFVINDLYPSGYGGNLNVTVREADGSEHVFDVPYSAVAQLLRPGTNRYSATAGKLRNDNLREQPAFGELTFQRGLSNSVTGYGGFQSAEFYQAAQAGVALGTAVGAFSVDTTWSQSKLHTRSVKGESIRLSYSKFIPASQTQFSLATWRYSTGNYLSLMDAAVLRETSLEDEKNWHSGKTRNRFTLTLNQGLPESWGQLYVTGIMQDYWGKKGYDQQYQAGYSRSFKSANWSLGVNRSRSVMGSFENIWTLSLTLPLGSTSGPLLAGQVSRDKDGHYGEQISVSDSVGDQRQFSWSAGATRQHQAGDSGQISGSWAAPVTTLSASYAQGKDWKSSSAGMSGTAVLHSGGVTFSPWTGSTFALVEAKGAEGAVIPGYAGTRIDGSGYALVPNLMPYQKNAITIDTTSVEDDLELDSTSKDVIPYAGAVVKMKYQTSAGVPVLVSLRRSNGETVPFSARAVDATNQTVGYVGQGGRLYARLAQQKGTLELRWGEDKQSRCTMDYSLPSDAGRKLLTFNALCNQQ